jgi:hypothetical protein
MADLILKIGATAKDFETELAKVRKGTQDLNNDLKDMATYSGVAFAALTAELGLSIRAYIQGAEASQRLNTALQNQGIYTSELAAKYRDTAQAISEKTGIDSAQIQSAQAAIQAIIGQKEVSSELIEAIVNLSVAKRQDLDTTAELIGKGINGHAKALEGLSIHVDAHLSREQKLNEILKQVTTQYGGQAEAAEKGGLGLKNLERAFTDLQRAIGAEFAPAIAGATESITHFIDGIREHPEIVKMTAALIAGGAALAGIVAALATAAVAVVSFTTVVTALGISLAVATGGLSLLAAGGIAAAAALGYAAVKTDDASTAQKKLQAEIDATHQRIERLRIQAAGGPAIPSFVSRDAKDELKDAEAHLAELETRIGKVKTQAAAAAGDDKQNEARAEAAKKRQAERDARDKANEAALRAHNQVMVLESQRASKETIALAKDEADTLAKLADEKNKDARAALQKHLAEVRAERVIQDKLDKAQKKEFEQEDLKNNKEFQALSDAEKKQFLLKNQSELQSEIQTASTTRQAAARATLSQQIKDNNTYLENQRKFGSAYATIFKAMHSEVFEGTKQAFGEMEQMTQSHNATLKQIGKIAAVANIVIQTATSAMNVFAGFSTIPIIGETLGLAAAAAVVAYGAERVSEVNAAYTGGIVPGADMGRDNTLMFLGGGEGIIPSKRVPETFDALVEKRARESGAGTDSDSDSSSGGFTAAHASAMLDRLASIDQKLADKKGDIHFNGNIYGGRAGAQELIQLINYETRYGGARVITQAGG